MMVSSVMFQVSEKKEVWRLMAELGEKRKGSGFVFQMLAAAVVISCAGTKGEIKPGLSAEEQRALIVEAFKTSDRGGEKGEVSTAGDSDRDGGTGVGDLDVTFEKSGSEGAGLGMGSRIGRPVENVSGRYPGLPLGDVLDRIGKQAGWTVETGPGVPIGESVDVSFSDIPAYEAVESVVRPLDLAVRYEVGRKSVVVSRLERRSIAVSLHWAIRPLVPPASGGGSELSMRYAQDPAGWLDQSVRRLLSAEGRLFVDPVGGLVIVEDRPSVVESVAKTLAEIEKRMAPVSVEVAVIRARKVGPGVAWGAVSTRGGRTAGDVGIEAASMGMDVVDNVMKLLAAYEPEIISRPQVETMNGWGFVLSVAIAGGGKGWQISVVPHNRGSEVLLEASGGFVDGTGQSFSTAARVKVGVPLLISTGAASVTQKRMLGGEETTAQEIIFVIRTVG